MRIAVINCNRRRVGGVETYLNTIIPELAQAGHEVAFWSEYDEPANREQIALPKGSPSWCVAEIGWERALQGLRDWQPNLTYTHNLSNPKFEAETQRVAPSVFFAHDYYGTCISGSKTFKFPVVQPCNRRFGWQCLAHYFPHRCGGWSPITMVQLYRLQTSRQKLLHSYDAIVTHSNHMLAELIKHGLSPESAYNFPYYVQQRNGHDSLTKHTNDSLNDLGPKRNATGTEGLPAGRVSETKLRLVFSGRMEFLKGGHVFLESLPQVVSSLGRQVQVVFAGEGRERAVWQEQANDLQRRYPELEIEFPGWVDRQHMNQLLDSCDLQVVPSLWPEPFGLVGPEAGLRGVPAAAFSVGGVKDWLQDGVNGYLAPGNPPTAAGLAGAIIRCLKDPSEHAQLRLGAVKMAGQFSIKNHLSALMKVFEQVAARGF